MKRETVKAMFAVALMASAAAVLYACATTQSSQKDASIESSIADSYAFRNYLQNDNIVVDSRNGKVTLTGTVPDESHKMVAQQTAENIAGVKSVDNQLQVEGGSPKEGSDAWLGAKVKAELLSHRDVNALDTDVYVKNGIVTLQGQAESQAQKNLTAEYARNVKGVKGVVNEITVAGAPSTEPRTLGQTIDDATITAQAKTALLANRSTSALDTNVDTKDGIVTITGIANNQAEKDLVTRIVADIGGVKGVINDMTVQEPASFTE
ncbi:MAG TPA: BON domain-containing protein [Deltaproteobacteria bacterium]|nr:BON domain-containing protein [Deltaproteobacteria bacterium]